MSKYAPLAAHLREVGQETVPMTFADIERIIGTKLPPSAFKHRPWWSNNPANSVITRSWLEAGYKTQNVDMEGRKLVFRKSAPYGPAPEAGGRVLRDEVRSPAMSDSGSFSSVFGALKGTVTIKPGTDLTAPAEADWEAGR